MAIIDYACGHAFNVSVANPIGDVVSREEVKAAAVVLASKSICYPCKVNMGGVSLSTMSEYKQPSAPQPQPAPQEQGATRASVTTKTASIGHK